MSGNVRHRRAFLAHGLAWSLLTSASSPSSAFAGNKKIPRDHGESTMSIVPYAGPETAGTIVISNRDRTLLRILHKGKAERYRVSIGRPGFEWTGVTFVGRKAEWPSWRPPADMRKRDSSLPSYVPPGPYNPLGARAIYLYVGGKDTLYRIHGTNNAGTVGNYETSGCFRLTNRDVMDLYERVHNGTKVVVY